MEKAAIFDMDGLMYDTERITLDAWLYASKVMHFPLTKEQCDSFRGTNKQYKQHLFDEWFHGQLDYDAVFSIRQKYIEDYLNKNGVPVKKGLHELLNALKEHHYKIAVATSTARKKAERFWKETNVYDFLDTSVCGDEVSNSKPDPEIFLKAADKLSVPIEQCLILEDSYNGIEAAKKAGGIVIMIPDTLKPTEKISKMCNYIFDDLSQVINIL